MSPLFPQVFANPKVMSQGWYWALASQEIARGEKRELRIFGEYLLLYRGHSGKVYCIEAFCPHMGANLKEGTIEGDSIRCGFHGWKFSETGKCSDIPCSSKGRKPETIRPRRTYLAAEKFGMIWLHTDPKADLKTSPLPSFPALEGMDVTCSVDRAEIRNCHPTLILGGGVDEEHFLFVHRGTTKLTGPLSFLHERVSPTVIRYQNTAQIAAQGMKSRMMSWLYQGLLKYNVSYWYASTALAELGTPRLPLYSIFAYRPTADGRTEGLNIYVTKKRQGPIGWITSFFALWMTKKILRKGGGEDTPIQNSIRFKPSLYAFDNDPFRAFVEYVEQQPVLELRAFQKEPALEESVL